MAVDGPVEVPHGPGWRPWPRALLLGMLREATIIPATNQPILDLLLAFGPFTLAAFCLFRAASIRSGRTPINQGVATIQT